MILTDTHTHLYSEAFDIDRDQMIERALKAGISRFYLPAIDSSYTKSMYALERKYPENIFLMTGLHPTHVKHVKCLIIGSCCHLVYKALQVGHYNHP